MENLNNNYPQIDYSKTTSLETWSGGKIWMSGYVLRTISKFINGVSEDQLVPIQVFFDPATGQILDNTLPPEIRPEYMVTDSKDNSQNQTPPTTPPLNTTSQPSVSWEEDKQISPNVSWEEAKQTPPAQNLWGKTSQEDSSTKDTQSQPTTPTWGKF